jgi:5-(carboxyamino)imidazole ribonucleotide mutase
MPASNKPLVGIIMGSQSDWEIMENAANQLKEFKIPYTAEIVSAHRTPLKLKEYALSAESKGIKVIIAGAGGAAHLPGMAAALTTLPVMGVPVTSKTLDGLDSLLSIVQMPAGIPVHTFAIGRAGAINAALAAASILALNDKKIDQTLKKFRKNQTQKVLKNSRPVKAKKK